MRCAPFLILPGISVKLRCRSPYPDLGRRLREDAPWNPLDMKTLYGGGATGYTDYPALA